MNSETVPNDAAVQRMRAGSEEALAEVFSQFRERLRQIIRFRLDYRLAGRVSDSDVLQDTYLAAAKRLQHFGQQEGMPAFLWLRLVAAQQLVDLHRQHLQAEMRDARKEVSLAAQGPSPHTSLAIAAHLVASQTGVSEIVSRAESIQKLETTLNAMDAIDREVIALRHFEELSNIETAEVLKIEPSTASKRYVRAMSRLGDLMRKFSESDQE